jgi:hypothetical protein
VRRVENAAAAARMRRIRATVRAAQRGLARDRHDVGSDSIAAASSAMRAVAQASKRHGTMHATVQPRVTRGAAANDRPNGWRSGAPFDFRRLRMRCGTLPRTSSFEMKCGPHATHPDHPLRMRPAEPDAASPSPWFRDKSASGGRMRRVDRISTS